MIEHVEFRNFKALRDVSVDLERFTVLVGPNGSGKTSVLEGLHYLIEACSREEGLFGGDNADFLRTSGIKEPASLACWGKTASVRLELRDTPEGQPKEPHYSEIPSHVSDVTIAGKDMSLYVERTRSGESSSDSAPLARGVLLQLDPKRLASGSQSDAAVPRVAPDGHGLASVLANMHSTRSANLRSIEEHLRAIVPTYEGMRFPWIDIFRPELEVITVDGKTFSRQVERHYPGHTIEFNMVGGAHIPARMMSEGTMLVLGLLAVLLGPTRPNIVLLDDLDRALHPKAQRDLVSLLRRLLDQTPDLQIIGTSHSPYLLDHLRPEEIRLTTLRDDGSVVCGRLDDHPEFEKWKDAMTPGEFWSMVGEDWLAAPKAKEPAG